jgi:hypothetical protein
MAVEDQLREVQSLIALEVERASSQQIEAAERIKVAQAALLSADEFLAIQRDRYRNGLANQTEVLAAEARRADGQRNLFNARYDHALAVVVCNGPSVSCDMKQGKLLIAGVVLALGAALGYGIWQSRDRGLPEGLIQANGRLEGDSVLVAANIRGGWKR